MPADSAPFIGLAPFEEDDATLFFGREAECDLIIANVMAARFTVVYGSSGVGKSSLMRAGVAHHLREAARENLRSSGTPQLAVTVFATWRDDPLPVLLRGIRRSVAEAWQAQPQLDASDSNSIEDHLDAALRRGADSVDGEFVVILDQFEEYFQYHTSGKFLTEFARAVANESVRASFVISIREDALAKLDCFEGQISNTFSNLLRIDHLDRDAARRAIEAPIEVYNRRNPARADLEPAVVEAVLDQVRLGHLTIGEPDRPDAFPAAATEEERIEAPYLQLVMKRLWDTEVANSTDGQIQVRLRTLEQLGGAERIVHTHLDATMDELFARERNIAGRIFRYLVTPSGTKVAHSAADLSAYAAVAPAELEPVLARLCAARILQPVASRGERVGSTRYEIFHDLLAAPILDWRLRFLRDTERDLAGHQLAVERRRVWYLRRRVMSLSALLLAVGVLTVLAMVQTEMVVNAQQVAFSRDASQRLESLFLACFAFGALFTLASAALGAHGLGAHGVHIGHSGAGHAAVAHQHGDSARRLKLPMVNPSALLAFLTWFGAAGYLLERFADWILAAVLLGAVVAGGIGWYVIMRFFDLIQSGEREMDPEEYRLEGTIGRVTVAIPAGGTGEVVFTKGGVRRSEAARALAGPIPRGTEVLITRYAKGFATVEPWSALLD